MSQVIPPNISGSYFATEISPVRLGSISQCFSNLIRPPALKEFGCQAYNSLSLVPLGWSFSLCQMEAHGLYAEDRDCASCWYQPQEPRCKVSSRSDNDVERYWDQACPDRESLLTYCSNHPHRRPKRDPIPIGPLTRILAVGRATIAKCGLRLLTQRRYASIFSNCWKISLGTSPRVAIRRVPTWAK